ncbi:alpha/beta fold hydrolase [Thioalkalicoccus limnaeus]|uniref:Alpha/beta fold hydrolase n=1 Tax=Thioalkalicoccus limnaeus TaxID=120681 RepID=A0ABV4BBU9_9GAMM
MKNRTKRRANKNAKGSRGTTPKATTQSAAGTAGNSQPNRAAPNGDQAAKTAPTAKPRATASRPSTTTTGSGSLPPAVSAPRNDYVRPDGIRLNYYVDGPAGGRPLLLIHAINAAPSVYELKPLFEHYRTRRRVYALDFPGFGFSDRGDRRYSPQLYTDTIVDFVTQVIKEPVDVVALSLGSEFATQAALRAPELFATLTLISPTGFSDRRLPNGEGQVAKWAHKVLSVPLWGPGLFKLLATRPSIRYFMKKSFVDAVPAEYIEYAYAAAHQPGAHHAPLYFLSGQLFTTDAYDRFYSKVSQPVLVIHDRDPNVSFERLPALLAERPNWQEARIAPSLGLPHWEKLAETAEVLDRFWADQTAAPVTEAAAPTDADRAAADADAPTTDRDTA